MAILRRTPIVVGVGDIKNRSQKIEDALEPAELMLRAIKDAIKDTKLPKVGAKNLQDAIDSIDVVRTWTWSYPDLPGLLAEKLGVTASHQFYSENGGDKPAKLFDEAARRISFGKSKVAVVTGGEALASLNACAKAKNLPPPGWTKPDQNVESVFSPTTRDLGTNLGATHNIGAPIHIYPLYENGFRAHRGQTIQANNRESTALYADFAKIAEGNPFAWNHGKPAETEESIGTVSAKNRMICLPYPLLMNAFNTVNLAGALILTDTGFARELGIPEDRWIYPLGGAGTQDNSNFWERPNFYSSPSISRSLDSCLNVSGLSKDEIDIFDFYSCFPIVPKLACHHLNVPILNSPKPITLLGGLTSFGGAGNNYSTHALTEMVRQLRKGNGLYGLVLANGGYVTYQYAVCLSSKAPKDKEYPERNPLPELITDVPAPPIEYKPDGDAVIETYTVEFKRDGTPLCGHIVGLLNGTGRRFLANHADALTLQALTSRTKEPIGRSGRVWSDLEHKGRNLFSFGESASL